MLLCLIKHSWPPTALPPFDSWSQFLVCLKGSCHWPTILLLKQLSSSPQATHVHTSQHCTLVCIVNSALPQPPFHLLFTAWNFFSDCLMSWDFKSLLSTSSWNLPTFSSNLFLCKLPVCNILLFQTLGMTVALRYTVLSNPATTIVCSSIGSSWRHFVHVAKNNKW